MNAYYMNEAGMSGRIPAQQAPLYAAYPASYLPKHRYIQSYIFVYTILIHTILIHKIPLSICHL